MKRGGTDISDALLSRIVGGGAIGAVVGTAISPGLGTVIGMVLGVIVTAIAPLMFGEATRSEKEEGEDG